MSRIGKQPVQIPEKVQVDIRDFRVRVKGPLGELERELPSSIAVERDGHVLTLKARSLAGGAERALYGMARARVANMVRGVQQGFSKTLEIVGLGFKASVGADKLVLNIGYSHPVEFSIPKGIKIEIDKKMTTLVVSGVDKDLVGEAAAQIRGLRPPEPYKGTGIRYQGERIIKKAGKTAAGASGGAGGAKK